MNWWKSHPWTWWSSWLLPLNTFEEDKLSNISISKRINKHTERERMEPLNLPSLEVRVENGEPNGNGDEQFTKRRTRRGFVLHVITILLLLGFVSQANSGKFQHSTSSSSPSFSVNPFTWNPWFERDNVTCSLIIYSLSLSSLPLHCNNQPFQIHHLYVCVLFDSILSSISWLHRINPFSHSQPFQPCFQVKSFQPHHIRKKYQVSYVSVSLSSSNLLYPLHNMLRVVD